MTDNIRTRLSWKVGAYYGVMFALIAGIGLTYPEWLTYLPFGGLEALQTGAPLLDERKLTEQLLATNRPLSLFVDAANLFSALAGSLLVMMPVRWVYLAQRSEKARNPEVATSLLVLPLVVATIVAIVKYSLPLAFALTGIFAGVRYRTTLKNQSDAFFTFACIAVGLAAGTRTLGIAFVLAAFVLFTFIIASPNFDDRPPDTSP